MPPPSTEHNAAAARARPHIESLQTHVQSLTRQLNRLYSLGVNCLFAIDGHRVGESWLQKLNLYGEQADKVRVEVREFLGVLGGFAVDMVGFADWLVGEMERGKGGVGGGGL